MKIISHRGAANLAPENSLQALRVSKNLGVDGVEIDVRVTKDNQLVVFHDKTLVRLAHSDQEISKMTLADLRRVKLRSGVNIVSLEDFFENSGSMPLVVEGKGSGWADLLAKAIASYKNRDTVSVIAFDYLELAEFKKNSPSTETYALSYYGMDGLRAAQKYGFNGISVFYIALLNPLFAYLLKKHHLKLNAFTANKFFVAKLIDRLYPGISITTDSPHLLKKPIGD